MSDDFEIAVAAMARMRGVSVETLKRQMLENSMGLGAQPATEAPSARREMIRHSSGDASGAGLAKTRQEAIERHRAEEFPGSPVVRYEEEESPEEAQERWYESEARLEDGVHGLGGSTAGGIFGDAPIATNIYDPQSMGRADARTAQQTQVHILSLVEKLSRRLDATEPQVLPPRPRGALPGATSRRLGGKK